MFNFSRLSFFLVQGFVLGAGPCLLFCGPILLPYIAGTKRTWIEGLKITLIFSLTRMVIYTILAAVSGYVGFYLFNLFTNKLYTSIVWIIGSAFIILIGILLAAGKIVDNPLCRLLNKGIVSSTKSMVVLGILIGISPCLPLLAVLLEIAILSEKIWVGAIYGFAFGIGTVLSPLLILGALAPVIPATFFKGEKAQRIFRIVCGILLILVGLYIAYVRVSALGSTVFKLAMLNPGRFF